MQGLDLNTLLVQHAPSTFYMRVAEQLSEYELHAGDILMVDRALKPKRTDLVVVIQSDDRDLKIARFGQLKGELELWGVVSKIIRELRQ